MIQQGTVTQARTLAEQRWKTQFPFDLDPSTWDELFAQFRPAEVLHGITMMRGTRDTRPEKVYIRFQQMLDRIAAQRS